MYRYFLFLVLLVTTQKNLQAQCPANIDFELGDFTNWECWVGHTFDLGGKNAIIWDPPGFPVSPALYPNRFAMYTSFPGNGRDPFGHFPVNCPNGSGHSIKLGNDMGGNEAEGVSYTFTIPAGQNTYNLIYNYAVVFQDPGHAAYQQPRLQIEIFNITDGKRIDCSSFDFIASSGLPGFFLSPTNTTGTDVWCKNWSANSVKLDGLAGKTIRVFFKTADCIFTQHFGYAYIDVNTQCSSSFTGATYCPDDAFINVSAPFGYQKYTWWDAGFTTILGNTQTINFTPPPPSGTTIAVVTEPYAGYGCIDTLYANLFDTLTLQSNAGRDTLSCNLSPVLLGVNNTPGYSYSWSPTTALSNPSISNPIATPLVTTQYVVTTANAGGGCATKDTVLVTASQLDSSITQIGPSVLCYDGVTNIMLQVQLADSIQWYRNNVAIPGANQTQYMVLQTGDYYATVFSFAGCSSNTVVKSITIHDTPNAAFATNTNNQCFKNNQFVFTNNSTIASGTIQYTWSMGDGTVVTSTDVTYSYSTPGSYTVKLMVISDSGCIDSAIQIVNVYQTPVAGFTININEQCFKNNKFVFTNTTSQATGNLYYTWDMGDGNFVNSKDVVYSYAQPGNYRVKLLVDTDNSCPDSISFNVTVNASPVAGFTVPNAQQCFANNLFNLTNTSTIFSGTMQYVWTMGDGTTLNTADVSHSYVLPGDYVVKMLVTSDKGCTDSSIANVKVLPFAVADFTAESICINKQVPIINKTFNNTSTNLNYLWDFGNGQSSAVANPVYSYPMPGTYTIRLSVNTSQCPLPLTVKTVDIVIEAPVPGIRYPDKDAVINFPEPLQARQIGNSVLWQPSINLDYTNSYTPNFKGEFPRLYTIKLTTEKGCVTIDTQYVKTHKKIEIYVPATFTPDNNGLNDYLRPLLMGFRTVNYFRVYNRWGKMLFQMQSDRPGWDGRLNGVIQDTQTIVWMIEAVDVDGVVHRKQGTTVLLR